MFFKQLPTQASSLSYFFGCAGHVLAVQTVVVDEDRIAGIADTFFVGAVARPDLSGKPSSTMGFEKRWSPFLSMDKDTFVRELTAFATPRPAEMARMVAPNISA